MYKFKKRKKNNGNYEGQEVSEIGFFCLLFNEIIRSLIFYGCLTVLVVGTLLRCLAVAILFPARCIVSVTNNIQRCLSAVVRLSVRSFLAISNKVTTKPAVAVTLLSMIEPAAANQESVSSAKHTMETVCLAVICCIVLAITVAF